MDKIDKWVTIQESMIAEYAKKNNISPKFKNSLGVRIFGSIFGSIVCLPCCLCAVCTKIITCCNNENEVAGKCVVGYFQSIYEEDDIDYEFISNIKDYAEREKIKTVLSKWITLFESTNNVELQKPLVKYICNITDNMKYVNIVSMKLEYRLHHIYAFNSTSFLRDAKRYL